MSATLQVESKSTVYHHWHHELAACLSDREILFDLMFVFPSACLSDREILFDLMFVFPSGCLDGR